MRKELVNSLLKEILELTKTYCVSYSENNFIKIGKEFNLFFVIHKSGEIEMGYWGFDEELDEWLDENLPSLNYHFEEVTQGTWPFRKKFDILKHDLNGKEFDYIKESIEKEHQKTQLLEKKKREKIIKKLGISEEELRYILKN